MLITNETNVTYAFKIEEKRVTPWNITPLFTETLNN